MRDQLRVSKEVRRGDRSSAQHSMFTCSQPATRNGAMKIVISTLLSVSPADLHMSHIHDEVQE